MERSEKPQNKAMEKLTLGNTSAQHWKELPFKDKVAHVTAVLSFLMGWIIAFAGLVMPPMGKIDPTVITIFGIAVGYCGAWFGIVNYIKNGQSELYTKVMDDIKNEIVSKHDDKE